MMGRSPAGFQKLYVTFESEAPKVTDIFLNTFIIHCKLFGSSAHLSIKKVSSLRSKS